MNEGGVGRQGQGSQSPVDYENNFSFHSSAIGILQKFVRRKSWGLICILKVHIEYCVQRSLY